MPFLGESSILFGGFTGPTAGYVPAGAILLDGSADYLTQTFSSSGDRDDYTRSVWVKRSGLSSDMRIFDTGPDGGNNLESLYFDSNNNLFWTVNDSNVTCYNYETSAVFRDPTAWTHIVCSRTGTTLTLYVNGVAVSAFDTSTNNVTTNNGRWTHTDQNVIGRYFLSGSQYFNGYLAEIIQIDGTALGADSFGEFDANGNWVPIDPSGLTFGTNGFWLDFANSADLGNDVSGNNNDWTLNSMSSANATNDNPADDATNDLGNRWVTGFDSVYNNGGTLSNQNLTLTHSSDPSRCLVSNALIHSGMIPTEGWEFHVTSITGDNQHSVYLMQSDEDDFFGAGPAAKAVSYDGPSGVVKRNGTTITTANTYGAGDTVEVWIGSDSSGTVKFYKNGSLEATVTSVFANDERYRIGVYMGWNASVHPTMTLGFYDLTPVNSGKEFNTAYLPAPTVTDPSAYFNTVLYEGNGTVVGSGGNAITNVGFQPDFVWIKNRDAADEHMIYDAVRGVTKDLNSDSTSAEATDTEGLSTFDADGFTVGSNVAVNTNAESYVTWCMKAGGSGSSNTDGSKSSTVSVADHNGFAIINADVGATSSGTIGHGMGQAPEMIIGKPRDNAYSWGVYHKDIGETKALFLESTSGAVTRAMWNNTAPTSSVFSFGNSDWINNCIFYAFARTPSLIGIGSYTGNGSSDGPYVVVDDGGSGFRPAFVLIKNIDAVYSWVLYDNQRGYNGGMGVLSPDSSSTESTGVAHDFVANGFKVRRSHASENASGNTYIYLAFAEYPFGGDTISQARAR